jgi:diguanylate cyclase (GGDEF)-like protein
MRLYSRNDLILIAGFTTAAFVVFSRPLARLLTYASEIEQLWGLNLISGLVILTVVMILHAQSRRQEMRAQTLALSAEAEVAQARARELERLVAFSAALARALDLTAIRNEVLRYMPQLLSRDDGWVVVRSGPHWTSLLGGGVGDSGRVDAVRERLAEQFFTPGAPHPTEGDWVTLETDICFPLVAGGQPMGLIGIPLSGAPTTDSQRSILSAGAAVLAIAVRNADLFGEVRDHSLRDGLTGCFNRTHGIETLTIELRRARRTRQPVSLIMFDLDHFKQVNDRYGHLCGDAVLAAVGRRLRELLRSSDLKCRYGGEEFLVVLPETPLEGAQRVAESLHKALGEMRVPWANGAVSVTASFGVTSADGGELEASDIIARADSALYRAKDEGRDGVRVASGRSA